MAATRLSELDALRGVMLLLMTVTHMPTRLSSPLGQPFGYVSAAEGFVLLSAYMAGLVYGRTAQKKGVEEMSKALWRRAYKVYASHIAILLFLFTVIAVVGLKIDQPAVKNLMEFYLQEPFRAFGAAVLMVYRPPLLDILPMYVLFMLASPVAMSLGHKRGWGGVLAGSIALWVLSQFGLGKWLYDVTLGAAGSHVGFNETGAFAIFAWQLLWIIGLWLGTSHSKENAPPLVFPRWAVVLAVVLGVGGMVWRHMFGQTPFDFGSPVNPLFDKWELGPLRMVNLFALTIIVVRFGPLVANRKDRWPVLETLGSASLPVFTAQLVIVLMTLAVWGSDPLARPWWGDVLLLAACFVLLYLVARFSLWSDRQSARVVEGHVRRKEAKRVRNAGEAESVTSQVNQTGS